MQRKALAGLIVAVVVAASIIPAYALAQRNAIASLEFDFEKFELTDIDFSETNSFGSMQRIVENGESPSLSMLSDFQSIQSSVSSPQAFALDVLANTRLVYSMFIQVRNPSFIEAVIDRADVQVLINGRAVSTPVTIQHKQAIPAGGQTTIELQGISVSGKEIAAILSNVALNDFVLTFDLAIGTYFPTLFGDVQVPAYANLQMYLIPAKPSFTTFEDPLKSGIHTVSASGRDFDYKLSIANNVELPLNGKLEVGVMKGNFLSGIGICDPSCIAPVDSGFATFLRIKGHSLFGTQLYGFEDIKLEPGEGHTASVTNPELRSNAKSAFIMRWAPDYSKIPYVMTTDIQGTQKTVTGEYESTSFSTVRKIVYNIVRDFGYVGSQEFISPDKSTSLTFDALIDDEVTFSGKLTDSYGNDVTNAMITIRDRDPLSGDDFMASGSTDSNGRYRIDWTPTNNDLDSVADAYAVFEGNSYYERSTSQEIQVSTKPTYKPTSVSLISSTNNVQVGDIVNFRGLLVDNSGRGIPGAPIVIMDSDPLGDDFMQSGYTNNDGEYSITWTAEINDLDNVADSIAVFEGDDTYERSVSNQVKITVMPYQPITYDTSISFFASSTNVYEGDTVAFSGKLVDDNNKPIDTALVTIKDDDPLSGDDFMAFGYTDLDGNYEISWTATINDPDAIADAYAVFEGDATYEEARSDHITISVYEVPENIVQPSSSSTSVSLSVSSTTVNEGDNVMFTGYLLDEASQGISGKLIEILDRDPLNADDLLASGNTNDDGRYAILWTATIVDLDNVADAYALFEGDSTYEKSESQEIQVTVIQQ